MDLNFDKLFKQTVFCLKLSGAHPGTKKNYLWALHFLSIHGLFTTFFLSLLYSIVFHDSKKDIAIICGNCSWAIIYVVITFKYLIMLIYRHSFIILINVLRQDYSMYSKLSTEEKKILIDYAKKGKFMVTFWYVTVICTCSIFALEPVVFTIYSTISNDRFEYVPVLDVTFPPLISKKDSVQYIMVAYILETFFALYSGMMYLAVVPLGLIFMFHACGRLEVLKVRVLKLFPKDGSTLHERSEKLKEIASDLQDIYDFVERIQTVFKLLYELTMKGSSIILPILGYVCIELYKQGEFDAGFLILFTGTFALSGFPCYCGDLLNEKGNRLREAVYFSGWECVWERRTRTSLLILMTRMQRTIAIRSMFRVICLESLTDVYHQAYALFNLLNAAWN